MRLAFEMAACVRSGERGLGVSRRCLFRNHGAVVCTAALCSLMLRLGEVTAADVVPRNLVTSLKNPCGVAVHAESGHVFIATRFGVYRYPPEAPERIHIEFLNEAEPTDAFGEQPRYEIGPLGVAFLDNAHLVVGDGNRKTGEEVVRIYKIDPSKDEPPHEPFAESVAELTLGPIPAGEASATGEGDFYGVAVGAGAIFVTSQGDDAKGWILKAPVVDGKPASLAPAIATKPLVGIDAPAGITFSPDGKELVVSHLGELDAAGDSAVSFFDPAMGQMKRTVKASLHDLTGVAYSPKTGRLYGVDFAWSAPADAGLFELVFEGETIKPRKVVALDKPTALAFDAQGNLYITILGTQAAGTDQPAGGMLVLEAAQIE